MNYRISDKANSRNLRMEVVRLVIFMLLSLNANEVVAQSNKRVKQYNLEGNVAIKGYDPVSYFLKNKAEEGSESFAYTQEGVTYYFANAGNRNLFIKSPDKYEPQYGGWCAYAMGAKGEKEEIDPETFKISNGKLYLFYNKFFNNTRNSWNEDENNLRAKADANWNKIYK